MTETTTAGPCAALTPVQERTLSALRRAEAPVVFDQGFVADLRQTPSTGWPS